MKHFSYARCAVLIAAIAFFVLSLGFAWLHLTGPSDGARLGPEEPFGEGAWRPDGILATPIEDPADGLHQSDLIVAIDGTSIQTWAQAITDFSFPRPQWNPGQQVIYSVVRNGIRLDVPVLMRPYPLKVILAKTGTLPFVMATFLVSAIYIFVRRPGERAAFHLLIWSICMGSAVISVLLSFQATDLVGGFEGRP